MDLSAMEWVLIAAAAPCILLLLAACYRWCTLVHRVRASRQDMVTARRTSIAVISTTPLETRPSANGYSQVAVHEMCYGPAYQMTQPPPQVPPYLARPPPYEPPPVFPDEPPPPYASIARQEWRKQRRIRIARTRRERRGTNPSTNM